LNVSKRSVARARAVIDKAEPELIAAKARADPGRLISGEG
jgi:hypothetical protein